MAAPTWLEAHEKFSLSGNIGEFEGSTAFAVTGVARLDKNWSVNGGVGYAPDQDQWGYRAGVRVGW
jgi:hypothetical protein